MREPLKISRRILQKFGFHAVFAGDFFNLRTVMDIGNNIRALREMRGLTQKELAEASGITPAALSRLERGEQFSTNKLSEIAKALQTRISDIDPSIKDDLSRIEGQLEFVPKRLKQARERAGYSTARTASEALGIAYGTYSSHENGLRGIKGHDLIRYAEFFKVPKDWLRYGRGSIDDLTQSKIEQSGFGEPERKKKLDANRVLGARIRTISGDNMNLAAFGDETGVTAHIVNQWESSLSTPPLSALRGVSPEVDVGSQPLAKLKHFVPDEEIVAAFDGVLDGYGLSADRRARLAETFATALAEPLQLASGRDRAMARHAIARALARALKLADDASM